jgi:hypothetical protein
VESAAAAAPRPEHRATRRPHRLPQAAPSQR